MASRAPAPKIVIVSFFVTARYASQDDSTAFILAILRQLEELLGQDLPRNLPLGDLLFFYRLLLRQAAQHFEAKGQRLILAIDGLDEDRSSTRGLPSVTSLLPKNGDHGMRVVVASRHYPQIPADVAPDHPLRDPAGEPYALARALQHSPVAASPHLNTLPLSSRATIAAELGPSAGDIERLLHNLHLSDPQLLFRAIALDHATRDFTAEALTKAEQLIRANQDANYATDALVVIGAALALGPVGAAALSIASEDPARDGAAVPASGLV